MKKKQKNKLKVEYEDIVKIVSLYKAGLSKMEIARQTGWSYGVVVSSILKAKRVGFDLFDTQ